MRRAERVVRDLCVACGLASIVACGRLASDDRVVRGAQSVVASAIALSWRSPAVLSANAAPACTHAELAAAARRCQPATGLSVAQLQELGALAGIITQHLRAETNSGDLQTLALIELAGAPADRAAVDRAVETLDAASALQEARSSVQSDRAAVRLYRYADRHALADLLVALDASQRAATAAPGDWRACWNHALALTWTALLRAAARESARCSALSSAPSSLAPAAAAYRKLKVPRSSPSRPDTPRTAALAPQTHTTLSAEWPEAARDYAWDVALPEWSRAVQRGDTTAARRALATIDTIAGWMARHGFDASVAAARHEIDVAQQQSSAQAAQLGRSLELFAYTRSADGRQNLTLARQRLDSAERLSSPTSELRRWIALERANFQLMQGELTNAAKAFRALRLTAPELTTAFGNRVSFGDALTQMATGASHESLDRFDAIGRACVIAGMERCALSAAAMSALTASQIGDVERTERYAGVALDALLNANVSQWTWSTLFALRQVAETRGLARAASDLDRESLEIAADISRADLASESLHYTVAAALDAGDRGAARRSLEDLRTRWMPQLSGDVHRWSVVDLLQFDGQLVADSAPRSGLRMLDSAVTLLGPNQNEPRNTPVHFARATVRAQAGDTAAALEELDLLLVTLRARAGRDLTVFDATRIARISAAAATLSARMLRARGDAIGALEVLSGRSASARASSTRSAAGDAGCCSTVGTQSIAVRQVGDSVWVWTRHADRWRVESVAISPSDIRGAMVLDGSALTRLYGAIVARRVAAATRALCIDARGSLAQLPWSALRDDAAGRYLVEYTTVSLVEDATQDCRFFVDAPGVGRIALVDAAVRSGPRALPGARAELDSLASIWGAQELRVDAGRGSASVVRGVRGASLVHFAGHAILDRVRADRSYLSMSGGRDSMLTADRIARLDFRGVRLVILAACETRGATDGATGGFDSLAGAFLAAGSEAVIGAAWPVDDVPTAAFMLLLHRAVRDGLSPAAALRSAQLAALRSADPVLNAPRVWAAFLTLGGGGVRL